MASSVNRSKESVWNEIIKEVKECNRCDLHKYRKKAVPGEGSLNSKVFFLGEAPGRREDEEGRPFVGAAGKLLDMLLRSIGLSRDKVFITNVVKCRPPNNRDPREDEIHACSVHTNKILSLINPDVIVTLGNHAGKYVFAILGNRPWHGVSKHRGRAYELTLDVLGKKVRVIPTYHPAAALYNPILKRELENDFMLIQKIIHSASEKREGKTLLDFLSRGGR